MTSGTEGFRIPREAELDRVLRMLTRAYVHERPDFPDDPSVLAAYGKHDPEGAIDDWVVMWEGERPLSALRLFMRRIRVGDRELTVGGIGNVGTDPSASGRGLATRVMREAHRRARERGAELAVLVTDIPAFYERLGYVAVPQRELLAVPDPSAYGQPADAHVRALTSDVPASVRDLHARAAAAVEGRVVRDVSYWSRWIMDFHVAREGLDAIETDGAYLIGRSEESGRAYRVLEGAGVADALAGLIRRAAGEAERLKSPDEPIFHQIAAGWNADVAPRVRTGIMSCALTAGAPEADRLSGYLELDTF